MILLIVSAATIGIINNNDDLDRFRENANDNSKYCIELKLRIL